MNRREMIKSGLAVLSAVGIEGEVATVSAKNPQMFVLTMPGSLSCDEARALREQWEKTFKGSSIEGVKVLILEHGMTFQVVDKVD